MWASGVFLPSMFEACVSTKYQKSEQKDCHVQGHPGLHSEFQPVLGYYVIPCIEGGRESENILMSIICPHIYGFFLN